MCFLSCKLPFFQMLSSIVVVSWLIRKGIMFYSFIHALLIILQPSIIINTITKKKQGSVKVVKKNSEEVTLMDLPDLVLESILERLSPSELCVTAAVCKSLRHWCTSHDYFWEKHFNHKWATLLIHAPPAAALDNNTSSLQLVPAPDSIMAFYSSLETGKFWFPAQVYNREVQNGHVGFLLSCYDAQVSYDFRTNTFRARYSARGGQAIEENIEWNRLRKPAAVLHTDPHLLHVSDCLSDLKPNDHIEIQWRRSKEFPNGWWYGVVGHLESCHTNGDDDDDECNCQCYTNEKVVLEFKQYAAGSRWRRVIINRKEHQEVGNESDGFYGGIRRLCDGQEIAMWKQLWTISAASLCASHNNNNNSNNNS